MVPAPVLRGGSFTKGPSKPGSPNRPEAAHRALDHVVLLGWQQRQAGAFLHLGETTVRESRGPASIDREGKLRRWFLLPEFLGINAVLGAASGVLVMEER